MLGYLPTKEEYLNIVKKIQGKEDNIYRYLNFNELPDFKLPKIN
jgi:aconitate hydratase 2/2-methylisocitrate dehydratase